MKAALLRNLNGVLDEAELPDPVPGAGEIVVRVLAAPVLSYMREVFDGTRNYPLLLPLVPGCGPVGIVEQTGPDATRFAAGQMVFCDPVVRSRDDTLAPDIMLQGLIAPGEGAQRLQSHFRHGAFASRMLAPLENAHLLNGFAQDEAPRLAWLNTLLVPYGGWLAAGLTAGESVLVSGATGHFGSAGVAVALAMGAERVVALGRRREALNNLVECLGTRVRPVLLTGDEIEDVDAMKRASGRPIDRMLDMLSPIKTFAPVRAGLLALRAGGTAVLMGGVQADIQFPYAHLMRNSITIRGQYMYPRDAPQNVLGMIRSGLLSLAPFRVTRFRLAQVNEAIRYAAEHGGAFELTVLGLNETLRSQTGQHQDR
jgi:alcohol dehydrogenase